MATRALKHVPKEPSDLTAFATRETSVVKLYSPVRPAEQIDTGYRVEIKSIYSDEASAVVAAQRAKQDAENPDAPDTSFIDSLPEQIIAVTVRWWKVGEYTDTITVDGEALQATPENVRRIYNDPRFRWIAPQVTAHYLGQANFFGASSGS